MNGEEKIQIYRFIYRNTNYKPFPYYSLESLAITAGMHYGMNIDSPSTRIYSLALPLNHGTLHIYIIPMIFKFCLFAEANCRLAVRCYTISVHYCNCISNS